MLDAANDPEITIPPSPDVGLNDGNRRTRFDRSVDPEIKEWLRRIVMSHAHLCYIVRLFGKPETAGGQSLEGETYAARAARGDRTLLYDAVGFVGDELADIREQITRKMGSAPPTNSPPGTAGKVQAMVERADQGFDLFIAGDAKTNID